ncbi:MAG: hypothetical protein ACT443_09645, partial [Gemmatimonadota bacterium]
ALAVAAAPPLAHYVFEANLRMPGSTSTAGIAAYYRAADNRLDVWLDRERRVLATSGVLDGRALAERTTSLPADFRFDAWHQLLVTKNADRLGVALDGVTLQQRAVPVAPASVALASRAGSAEFDGIALTAHYEDSFAEAGHDWITQGGAWLVEQGALHQVAGGAQRYVALKGDAADDYEFTASVRLRDNESTGSQAGIVAAATGTGALVTAGFDRTIWPYARFHVQWIENGALRQALEVEMPRGFDYNAYHTIRAVKQGSGFTFHLDGEEIAAARFPIAWARPGLFTQGARAAFDDAAMKQLGVAQNLVLDGSFEAERWPESAATAGNPWQLAGGALVSMCCAHTGVQRLLLNSAAAKATQVIPDLAPGRYTLLGQVSTKQADAVARVLAGTRELARGSASDGAWQQLALDFELTAGQNTVTIELSPTPHSTEGFVAADDVFLFKH